MQVAPRRLEKARLGKGEECRDCGVAVIKDCGSSTVACAFNYTADHAADNLR